VMTPPGSRRASETFQAAISLHQQGRLHEAERLYRDILKTEPEHSGSLHHLGVLQAQQGRIDNAIRLIRRALRKNPHSAEAYNDLGVALEAAKRHADAIAPYEQALALRADYTEAYYNLGNALQALERHQEAIVRFEKAVELSPDRAEAHNNLGNSLHALDRHSEALLHYERALALNPHYAEAHNNLGNALRAQKNYDAAIAAYHRASQLKPDYADAYNNLGTAIRNQKKPKEAEELYRKALALKPGDSSILNHLALSLMDQKRVDEALALLQQSRAINPHNFRTYTYLARAYLDEGMHDEAKAACERALHLKPDDPDVPGIMGRILLGQNQGDAALAIFQKAIAVKPGLSGHYNNIANILETLGRFDEARDAYSKALEIDPKSTAVLLNLANTKNFAPDDPHLRAMEELAANADSLSEEDQIQLHFALGKAYADLRLHEKSFCHLLKGNALKRRTLDYNESNTVDYFDRIRKIFGAELLREKQGLGDPSQLPVFILGMPRSGTTLVEQILASHPRVFGAGEIKDLNAAVRMDGSREAVHPEFIAALQQQQLRQVGARYVSRLRAYCADAERITNKMPSHFFHVGLIHLALPNARIIHIRRNAIDTCLSCFSKLFADPQDYSYDLGELGRYYACYDKLMAHWRGILPEGAMLEVQYEELIEDFEFWVRRIVAYCDLEWNNACLAFHRTERSVRTASASQVRQPIFKTSVGRWQAYKDFLQPLIKELAGLPVE
jgi:tetratricopeptide (TPR) repeat protein